MKQVRIAVLQMQDATVQEKAILDIILQIRASAEKEQVVSLDRLVRGQTSFFLPSRLQLSA